MSIINIIGSAYKIYRNRQSEYFGEIRPIHSTIYINAECSEDRQVEALLHEVFHGINALLDVKLNESKTIRLANGIAQVLRANGVDLSPLMNLIEAAEFMEVTEEDADQSDA